VKKNMCAADRIIRLVLVAVAIVLLVTKVATGALAIVVGVIAALLLVTSATGICWLYVPLGISTGRKEPNTPGGKKDGSA
jgi:hypothetical protein